MKAFKNFIGGLIRDLIVYCSGSNVVYGFYNGIFVYRSWLPFDFNLGNYKFISRKRFDKIFNA